MRKGPDQPRMSDPAHAALCDDGIDPSKRPQTSVHHVVPCYAVPLITAAEHQVAVGSASGSAGGAEPTTKSAGLIATDLVVLSVL